MSAAAITAAERVLSAAGEREVRIKALGGIGCWLHASEHGAGAQPYLREYGDVDLVLPTAGASGLGDLMRSAGLAPVESFNANGGATRRLYASAETGMQVDVFIGSFAMCHEVPLEPCAFEPPAHPALSATELLLTKLQVVQLSDKDANDAASLLAFHEVADDPEAIDGGRIGRLLASDWGLWRTTTENLGKLVERADQGRLPGDGPTVKRRAEELSEAIDSSKKSFKWKTRAKVGDRVQWYVEPEEPVKESIAVR
jgi:hypothetical protein